MGLSVTVAGLNTVMSASAPIWRRPLSRNKGASFSSRCAGINESFRTTSIGLICLVSRA